MTVKIPEGFRQNASGDLVKIENIKEIDLQRDELVQSIAQRAQEHSGKLAQFKATVMDEIQAFVAESASRYKVRMGGTKGNLTLLSFDGRYKVQVASQDSIAFDERLQVAQELINRFFADLRGNEADSGLPGILCLSRTQTWEARCLWMRVWPGWADGKGARSGRWNGSRPE